MSGQMHTMPIKEGETQARGESGLLLSLIRPGPVYHQQNCTITTHIWLYPIENRDYILRASVKI